MSATMDADRFAAYWGPSTPRMHIPGFTHPVEDFFLYEVLRITNYIPPSKKKKKKKWSYNNSNSGGGGRKGNQSAWNDSELSHSDDCDSGDETATSNIQKAVSAPFSKRSQLSIEDLVARVDDTTIDYDMLATLVSYLSYQQRNQNIEEGSILVFLPGVGEIAQAERAVRKVTNNDSNLKILQLHGGLRAAEQRQVSERNSCRRTLPLLKTNPLNSFGQSSSAQVFDSYLGYTKVVLSTNVAETSITIPDCVFVIDCCKVSERSEQAL